MALTDTQIRETLIQALQAVEADIINFELPLSQHGYEGHEYFAKVGTYGKKSGQVRHWIASIVISDDKKDVDAVYQLVRGKSR